MSLYPMKPYRNLKVRFKIDLNYYQSFLDDVIDKSNEQDCRVGLKIVEVFQNHRRFDRFPDFTLMDPKYNNNLTIHLDGPTDNVRRIGKLLIESEKCDADIKLWLSVQFRNFEKIEHFLKFGQCRTSNALLIYAIERCCDVAIIKLLLNHGVPILDGGHCLGESIAEKTHMPHPLIYAAKCDSHPEIFQTLLDFVSNSVMTSLWASTLPVHYSHLFAIKAPEVATALIEHAHPENLSAMSRQFSTEMTPLFSCFHGIAMSHFESSVVAILERAVIPLMQSGAKLEPDPFTDCFLLRSLSSWSSPVLAHYLIEARCANRKNLNVRKFRQLVVKNDEKREIRPFSELLISGFPRSLMCLCRQVIVGRLPRGRNLRSQAVDSLNMPMELEKFLKFQDIVNFI